MTVVVVVEAAEHLAVGSGGTMMTTVMKAGVGIAMATVMATVKNGLRSERRGVSFDIASVCVFDGDSMLVFVSVVSHDLYGSWIGNMPC